jgi:hypothetical protein
VFPEVAVAAVAVVLLRPWRLLRLENAAGYMRPEEVCVFPAESIFPGRMTTPSRSIWMPARKLASFISIRPFLQIHRKACRGIPSRHGKAPVAVVAAEVAAVVVEVVVLLLPRRPDGEA